MQGWPPDLNPGAGGSLPSALNAGMRGWRREQTDELYQRDGGEVQIKWRFFQHRRGLSFVSAGGEEIPTLPSQVGA